MPEGLFLCGQGLFKLETSKPALVWNVPEPGINYGGQQAQTERNRVVLR